MGCAIVLVDDDTGFADVLAEVLRLERHEVRTFSTSDAALEWLLSGEKTDLVLLDLHMPGISAQRFQEILKSELPLRDLPVVIVSGDPDVQNAATAIGASDAFTKPVDVERLLATVNRFGTLN
jgi:DNA-binding NtrC family response regulator